MASESDYKPDPRSLVEAEAESLKDEFAARREAKQRATNRDLRAQIRDLNAIIDAHESTIETLEELRTPPPKCRVMKPRKRARGGKLPASFVALASDWHTCEIVTLNQTNGLNEHNPEIGQERAWAWSRGLVEMVKREQETCDVQSLVVWLGGDMMVNDGLHRKSERSVGMSPHAEARLVRDLLAQILEYLRAELDVPRLVVPTSWGNHDRSTDKMIPGHGGEYSFIQEVYRDLASWSAHRDLGIEFRIAESEWEVLDVHGYSILFHHGHRVGYGKGFAGLGRPILVASADKDPILPHRTLCIGHYHQIGWHHGGRGISNGSLVGFNGYANDGRFQYERPAQAAFVIDHERDEISNFYKIWAD